MPTDKDPVELERCDLEAEKLFRSIKNGTVHEVISKINEKPSLLQLQDASGRAALHFAAYFGRIDVIETLFKNEHSRLIDVDLEDFDGNTPLVLAVKQRDAKVTGYLIKVAQSNVSKQLKRNVTVLHHAACVSNNVEVLKIIMQSERLEKSVLTETVDGGTPLHWACHCNDIVNISYFLDDLDVNVDVRDEHGGSPLFVATFLKSTEVVRFLLERGANVLCSAKDGSTPLSLAIDEVKDIEVVRLLLSFAPIQKVKSLNLKSSDKMIQKEIESERMGPTERKEMCERFKKQGNNVFSEGQYMKAIRFYTLSISHDPTNHTLFSNRSACHFNLGQFRQALADARQCVRLAPGWVKGYYRLSAALYELGEFETCSEFCKKGLLLDSSYQDLKQVYERCQTKINSARASSNQV